ncbi:MAG: iron-sulfur cluster assembly protein, partial [Candidatus Dormibacteria bacterium]
MASARRRGRVAEDQAPTPARGPLATADDVMDALREVIDPELGLDVVSL